MISFIKKGIDTSDATATVDDILINKTAYANNEKLTGTMPNNGTLNYTPTTSQQNIPAGYTNGGSIAAVTATIDSNIKQSNIKAGVTILGVQGNVEPDKPDQTKTCTPTTSQQVIQPDTGYELASVTVNAVDHTIDNNIQTENIKNGVSILGVNGSSSVVDTSDANAGIWDILRDKTAYVNGQKVTGMLFDRTTEEEDLFSVFPISYEEGTDYNKLHITVHPMFYKGVVSSDNYYPNWINSRPLNNVLGITPEKIKLGEKISGVTGTYSGLDTSDATATNWDILKNKTAYVNGQKVTGMLFDYTTEEEEDIFSVFPVSFEEGTTNNKLHITVTPMFYKGAVSSDTQYPTWINSRPLNNVLGITPEKIKLGEKISGVVGTYSGLDTSDATATAEDIAQGKTAYVNGQKITGDSNVMDTSVSSVEPEYSTSGTPQFVLNQSTGYYEVSGACDSILEMSFNNPSISDIILSYKGTDITGGEMDTSVHLDGDYIESMNDESDYTNFTIQNVSIGNHTVKVEISSNEPTTSLSVKMLPISEAPATSADIMKGKVAYINGVKIVGTYEP